MMNRRKFLTGILATSSAASITSGCALGTKATIMQSSVEGLAVAKMNKVRFGFIGVGKRGGNLLRLLLAVDGAEITAICDTHAPTLEKRVEYVTNRSGTRPATYSGSDEAYKRMLERDDIDAVIIATPWRFHTPMAVDAMLAGKQAFVEVPAALTIDECWQLVETSEKTRVNCMMLENVCYGREEMMVLNMVRNNLFGELLHGEAAYIHDIRKHMKQVEHGTGSWRTGWQARRNANLYPTHGLGPIAQYMNINRGDQFDYLVSTASPALGRKYYAERNFTADHPRSTTRYIAGDINSSLIKTMLGRTIMLQYDTTTPRPYSRLNLIQGTNGVFAGYPNRIALENNPLAPEIKDGYHDWDHDMEKWFASYEHQIWKRMKQEALTQGGHGGMDFVMLWRQVYCLRHGIPLDQNVYDAAAWSVVVDLSELSVANRSAPIDFPDFTRGAWQTNKPLVISDQV